MAAIVLSAGNILVNIRQNPCPPRIYILKRAKNSKEDKLAKYIHRFYMLIRC